MRKLTILLAAVALVAAACSSNDPVTQAEEGLEEGPTTTAAPAPPPETDPPTTEAPTRLEQLHDKCAGGDGNACDDLYLESEFGSAEEEFGDTCGGRGLPADHLAWCGDEEENASADELGGLVHDEFIDLCMSDPSIGFTESQCECAYDIAIDNIGPDTSDLEITGLAAEAVIECLG